MEVSKKMVRECLKKHFENEKIKLGKKYFFASYLTTKDVKKSEGCVVNECYFDILDFGEFDLRILWGVSRDQHDFKRVVKKLYEINMDSIFPILSPKGFVKLIFNAIRYLNENFGETRILEFRASNKEEQIYHKYTGKDEGYILNRIGKLLEKGFDVYRVGISVSSSKKHYFEILRRGLFIYTPFNNISHLDEQIDFLFALFEYLLYEYYSSLPYIKDLSNLNYSWELGIQPTYNTLTVYLKEPLTKDKATEIYEEIKNDFGIIRSEITTGSLHINWHLYDRRNMDSTIIITTLDSQNPDKLIIIPTSEDAKKSALKIYEILNTNTSIEKLEISI